jgi:hypothetical protein
MSGTGNDFIMVDNRADCSKGRGLGHGEGRVSAPLSLSAPTHDHRRETRQTRPRHAHLQRRWSEAEMRQRLALLRNLRDTIGAPAASSASM